MEQALDNIAVIVRAAGCDVTNVGRLTLFVTDKTEYLAYKREVGKAYQCVGQTFSCDVAGHCE